MAAWARKREERAGTDAAKEEVLIEALGLEKAYATPDGPLPILRGVDFTLREGEMAFIVGRSGSGKSTLLHLLGGLDQPTRGRVAIRGHVLDQVSERRAAALRNREIGFVFQFYHLLPELSLVENVELPLRIAGRRDRARAEALLAHVGLADRMKHYPAQLSGGEQQRAAIARALANDPSVVLCDEPTGNLDEETAQSMLELLHSLQRERKRSFCIVTHDEGMVRGREHVYRLHDGRLARV